MTNYRKYFGTPELACITLSEIMNSEESATVDDAVDDALGGYGAFDGHRLLEWLESEADRGHDD